MAADIIPGALPDDLAAVDTQKNFKFSYGTAGLRCPSEHLKGIAVRLGVLAAMRSIVMEGRFVGVMITASHNPPCDNGIKLVDPSGGMLETDWETLVVDFVNCPVTKVVEWMREKLGTSLVPSQPHVVVGYDTRESSPSLAQEVVLGVTFMRGSYIELGLVTTPQLHFAVQLMNSEKFDPRNNIPAAVDLDESYVRYFGSQFVNALGNLDHYPGTVLNVDCAHGVGSVVLNKLAKQLVNSDGSPSCLQLHLYNTEIDQKHLLNSECGADFVKLTGKAPKIHMASSSSVSFTTPNRWATLDGDADRLLYFYQEHSNSDRIVLLDGDRIACLFASFISRLLSTSTQRLSIGVVQTAYANAASTLYLQTELEVAIRCVPTGVKHLHRAARRFDFGIYFEANGHGTVLFSETALQYMSTLEPSHPLLNFASLTNTAIGDAITDILLVEYALAWHGWSLMDWANLYTELPSRQIKVAVAEPARIKTMDAERRISDPKELQDSIDLLVTGVEQQTQAPGRSRAFVRPSGTEKIVRVYAESVSAMWVDWLAQKVAIVTYDLAGGTGEPPADPGPMPSANL